ncbi:HIRAN domain-containing protein [Blastomonas natatoria]|nr:HIRAN domain-containing protein [Blastomonas natatoria]
MAKYREAQKARPRYLPLAIVGESHYQSAILDLCPLEPVTLVLEPDNPFDSKAIAAIDDRGRTIGYVPADSWVRRALLKEKQACKVRVKQVTGKGRKTQGVVLEVALGHGEKIGQRQYEANS